MKYSISSAKAQKPAAPKFSTEQAVEALAAVAEQFGAACEGLAAAEQDAAVCEQVLADCGSALESVSKFGITPANMAILNGAGHDLDHALGLEELAIASIESLSDTTKAALKKSYEAGLEGKVAEYWGKFKAMLKKIWDWVKKFFKELFDRNAKYIRIVKENLEAFSKLDGDAKVAIIPADKAIKALQLITVIKTKLNAANVGAADGKDIELPDAKLLGECGFEVVDGKVAAKSFTEAFKAGAADQTLKQTGWADKAAGIAKSFVAEVITPSLAADFKKIDAAYGKLIADIPAGDNVEKEKKDKILEVKAKLAAANSLVMAYGKLAGVVGSSLVKVVGKVKKEAPAAK